VKTLADVKPGDTIRVHSGELVPADGILTRGRGRIDYSFVTGESAAVGKEMGELLYAGGRQEGGAIELLVVKEVSQGYLTQLWNRKGRERDGDDFSFVHPLSRYFTYVVLTVAGGAALYWGLRDPAVVWNAVTAVLIVACPCALLLSSTFTNGNVLRILGRNQLYLRNAEVIERIGKADHIVFDKTGTLTESGRQRIEYIGHALSVKEEAAVQSLAAQSAHPLSRALAQKILPGGACNVLGFVEEPGAGIMGYVKGRFVKLGSREFVTRAGGEEGGTRVYVSIDGRLMGHYEFTNYYREGIAQLASRLKGDMPVSVLSGDNAREKERLQRLLGKETTLLFGQSPVGKGRYIEYLQGIGRRVMMIGDGLN
ncbi:MAG: HAD-IC family P-type ATPase, partial [Bacteroidetes bacterium]|nr:HAD-IC family P-type ATPase [Bacteroidota bacterium]